MWRIQHNRIENEQISQEKKEIMKTYVMIWVCALQNKEQGEKEYQFKNGGIREWGKQDKNEDQQNNGLKHLDGWWLNKKEGGAEGATSNKVHIRENINHIH